MRKMGIMNSLIFQPPPVSFNNTSLDGYFIFIDSSIYPIPAFYINPGYAITVLFSHGNAEDLRMIYDWFLSFSRILGVNVLAYDYAGYGEASSSKQIVGESCCYAAIDSVYAFLTDVKGVSPSNLIVYGRSLGSGPSCYLAQRLQKQCGIHVGGLVLQSALMSIFRVVLDTCITLPGDLFCNINKIQDVQSPVWIIHGVEDEVVNFEHGELLFEKVAPAYRAFPLWVRHGGHNDLEDISINSVQPCSLDTLRNGTAVGLAGSDTSLIIVKFQEFLELWCPTYVPPNPNIKTQ